MSPFELIYCLVLLTVFFVIFSVFWHERRAGISPSPTLPGVRHAVVGMIRKHAGDQAPLRIAEFGCGWGGLVLRLAQAFPSSNVIGYEISPCPLAVSRLRFALNNRIQIMGTDFFEADWDGFDVIVCYLSPQHMVKIKAKLDTMPIKPLLVTCSFALPDAEPIEARVHRSLVNVPILAYR